MSQTNESLSLTLASNLIWPRVLLWDSLCHTTVPMTRFPPFSFLFISLKFYLRARLQKQGADTQEQEMNGIKICDVMNTKNK